MNWTQLEEADWLFRKLVRRFVKERDKVEIEGVSLPGILVLQKLVKDGDQRLSDLGEELDFTSGAVTGLCDKLERQGLAKRNRKEDDRRTVWLHITDDGKKLLDRHRNMGTRSITTLFDNLSAEQLQHQIELSTQIFNNLEQYAIVMNRLAQENTQNAAVLLPYDIRQLKDSSSKNDMNRPNQYLSY